MFVEVDYEEVTRYRATVEVDEDEFNEWWLVNASTPEDRNEALAEYIREQDVMGEVAVEIDGGIRDLEIISIDGRKV